jgi:hypothetical protein
MLVFTKLTVTWEVVVNISTELHRNQVKNAESVGRVSFTPQSEVWHVLQQFA